MLDTTDTLMSSIPDAMRRTGLSRSTLYRLMDAGQLAYVKVGARRLLPEDSLVNLVDRHRVDAG